jgi:hypothetical protein
VRLDKAAPSSVGRRGPRPTIGVQYYPSVLTPKPFIEKHENECAGGSKLNADWVNLQGRFTVHSEKTEFTYRLTKVDRHHFTIRPSMMVPLLA